LIEAIPPPFLKEHVMLKIINNYNTHSLYFIDTKFSTKKLPVTHNQISSVYQTYDQNLIYDLENYFFSLFLEDLNYKLYNKKPSNSFKFSDIDKPHKTIKSRVLKGGRFRIIASQSYEKHIKVNEGSYNNYALEKYIIDKSRYDFIFFEEIKSDSKSKLICEYNIFTNSKHTLGGHMSYDKKYLDIRVPPGNNVIVYF
jgi:hypothetical protein